MNGGYCPPHYSSNDVYDPLQTLVTAAQVIVSGSLIQPLNPLIVAVRMAATNTSPKCSIKFQKQPAVPLFPIA